MNMLDQAVGLSLFSTFIGLLELERLRRELDVMELGWLVPYIFPSHLNLCFNSSHKAL